MQDINLFLAHAMKLEQDAANRFADLAESMKIYGNKDVADFFDRMAQFSRLHLEEARRRSHYHDIPQMADDQYEWPDSESPESASMEGSHYLMTVEYALRLALESEQCGLDFYQKVLDETSDPEIKMMAEEFVSEEREHVLELQKWTARYAGKKSA